MLERRKDGPPLTRAQTLTLRRCARVVGCGVYVRAVAAVARQGLRAVGGARRVTVPRICPPAGGPFRAVPEVGARRARSVYQALVVLLVRRAPRALEDVRKVLTGKPSSQCRALRAQR